MGWLKRLFSAIARYFRTGRAASDAQKALEYVGKAMPYIVETADLIVSLTATQADDAIWAALKAKYPEVFGNGPLTGDALRRAGLQIAAARLREAFPELDVSISLAATQLAYLDYRAIREDLT